MNYKNAVVGYCRKLGLDTIGFADCRAFHELYDYFKFRNSNSLNNEFEEMDVEKRINPHIYMEEGKTIISIAFPYLFEPHLKNAIGFSVYTLGMDYHRVVMKYLNKVCHFINSLGGKTVALVDSNALPERYIAKLCGIGFIGKNNMVITQKYGSYVFLGEIITDLEIENSHEIENKCAQCSICINACPTKAIANEKNSNKCMSYITQKKQIEDSWILKFGGRLFGCDICQNACPYNRNIKFSSIPEFRPYDFMQNPDIYEIVNMSGATFRKKYALTSCGWRGKNIIIRNALINSMLLNGNMGPFDIRSPYIKDYYNRLLNILKL